MANKTIGGCVRTPCPDAFCRCNHWIKNPLCVENHVSIHIAATWTIGYARRQHPSLDSGGAYVGGTGGAYGVGSQYAGPRSGESSRHRHVFSFFSVSIASRISCSGKNCCQKLLFVFSGSGWVAVIIGFHAKVHLHATCLSFCWFLADIFS